MNANIRDFLDRPIPPGMREKCKTEYGVDIPEGASFREALKRKVLQMAREGNREAKKLLSERGFFDE